MINRINVGVDHCCSFCVCASDDDEGSVEHVSLQPQRDQTLSVLSRGDQNLAAHVATFLGTWLLILDMDACSAILNEHFAQLHGRCDAAVTGVCIGNDWVQ